MVNNHKKQNYRPYPRKIHKNPSLKDPSPSQSYRKNYQRNDFRSIQPKPKITLGLERLLPYFNSSKNRPGLAFKFRQRLPIFNTHHRPRPPFPTMGFERIQTAPTFRNVIGQTEFNIMNRPDRAIVMHPFYSTYNVRPLSTPLPSQKPRPKPKLKKRKHFKIIYQIVKNNIFGTLINPFGECLISISAGKVGFKGSRRKTAYAALMVGKKLAQQMNKFKNTISNLGLIFLAKPNFIFGQFVLGLRGELTKLRVLPNLNNFVYVQSKVVWPHSLGPRPKKPRKLLFYNLQIYILTLKLCLLFSLALFL